MVCIGFRVIDVVLVGVIFVFYICVESDKYLFNKLF